MRCFERDIQKADSLAVVSVCRAFFQLLWKSSYNQKPPVVAVSPEQGRVNPEQGPNRLLHTSRDPGRLHRASSSLGAGEMVSTAFQKEKNFLTCDSD